MKKRLVKMRVCLGFDCNPRLDIISYDDELSPNGNPYQSSKGVRNEKTEIGFGQTWVSSSASAEEPYWDSYMILDGSVQEQELLEKAQGLYQSSIQRMTEDVEGILSNLKEMKAPSIDEIRKSVSKMTGIQSGKYIVPIEKFKDFIYQNALDFGRGTAKDMDIPVEEWEGFFAKTLTRDILSTFMKGLPVLKFSGNGIEFQSKELFDQAVNVVTRKVGGDVFARFLETRNK